MNSNNNYIELGKLPPQATDIEEAVLGALMLEGDSIIEIIDLLKHEVFYKEEHKLIYKSILGLFSESKPIDILTVTAELRKLGKLDIVGGPYYISELTNRVGSSANIEYHSRILVEKYILREIIRISSEMQTAAFDESSDAFEVLEQFEKLVLDINNIGNKSFLVKIKDLLPETISIIEERCIKNESGSLVGIPSGFSNIDRKLGGFQNSDLIIIAARPGMGKTALILAMARNMAIRFEIRIAIFSLEMSKIQLVERILSAETETDALRMKLGVLSEKEWSNINRHIHKFEEIGLYIDDTPGLNIFELKAKLRRAKSVYNVDIIMIDYLQLMESENKKQNREQEISTISRALKAMAKELNVPVIALSQLSRDVEKRGSSKRPVLSDLRESGSIEQDADQVIFIYRPEYYGYDHDEDGMPTKGLAEIIISKNRHGATDTVKLTFKDNYATFSDYDSVSIDEDSFDAIKSHEVDSKEYF